MSKCVERLYLKHVEGCCGFQDDVEISQANTVVIPPKRLKNTPASFSSVSRREDAITQMPADARKWQEMAAIPLMIVPAPEFFSLFFKVFKSLPI